MPLELGLFLGAKKFGEADQKKKPALFSIQNNIATKGLSLIFRVRTHRHMGMIRGSWLRLSAIGFGILPEE